MDNKVLYNISYGLYLLSVKENGKDNACIINTAVQIAKDPVRISVSVIKENYTCEILHRTGEFTLSFISEDAKMPLFKVFGMQTGRDTDKFEEVDYAERGKNGIFHLGSFTNGYLDCKVIDSIDLGSHVLFIAEVKDGEILSERPSCTYSYYQKSVKPSAAVPKLSKGYRCSVCGYVYEGGDMPDDFLCPLCNHGKEDFEYFELNT
ncbi:MAG: flavin reductase [Ruminococcaceae bacterium]|nr:flavin reductase [Oscillospiraceae bacterium]